MNGYDSSLTLRMKTRKIDLARSPLARRSNIWSCVYADIDGEICLERIVWALTTCGNKKREEKDKEGKKEEKKKLKKEKKRKKEEREEKKEENKKKKKSVERKQKIQQEGQEAKDSRIRDGPGGRKMPWREGHTQ